jgi:hypothetical protein
MTGPAAVFAALFAALFAAHQVGDHWVQTSPQALGKGAPAWPGRLACARHVASLTAVALAVLALGMRVSLPWLAAGLALDAAAHYWADRRFTLARLARLAGKGEFYALGAPRPGRDDAPHLGTGAYALDQSFHIAFLFAAALITAGGAR